MAVSCVVIALVALGSVAPVQAADGGPGRYQQAQVGLTYTVYAPTFTAGLKRTSFALEGCGSGRDEFINANYGSQGPTLTTWIGMNQSTSGCIDGPDGVGPAATFTVKGAKVTVMGNCAGGASVCKTATRRSVLKGGYTTVTLPSGGDGLSTTFVEVYTQLLTVKQIRAFLNGLHTVQ